MKPELNSKAIREQLGPLAAQIRSLADKANQTDYKWTAEDETEWRRVNAEYDGLKATADRLARIEQVEVDLRSPVNADPPGRDDYTGKGKNERQGKQADREGRKVKATEEHRALAMQAWMRAQSGKALSKRQEEACRITGVNPRRRSFDVNLRQDYKQVRSEMRAAAQEMRGQGEQRALSVNVNTTGGYTVPQGFVSQLEIALLAYANVREWCDVMRTESGNDLPWPTVNDTSNKGALLAENSQVSSKDLVFGQEIFHAYKYTTGLILVPAELMEDSAFNLAEYIGQLFGIRFGRIQADHFTFGTGVGQPTGYVTAATLGVTTASPTAIAADELYNLKHSVDPAYRPGAMWTFHDQVLLYIKKLKDGLGRYLWQASLAGGRPDTLDGDPIGINQSMANAVSANNITVAYGQMPKYKVRDVNSIRMRRLVERYADFDQEGFVGFMRTDGLLIDAGTHPIKYLQQHS